MTSSPTMVGLVEIVAKTVEIVVKLAEFVLEPREIVVRGSRVMVRWLEMSSSALLLVSGLSTLVRDVLVID